MDQAEESSDDATEVDPKVEPSKEDETETSETAETSTAKVDDAEEKKATAESNTTALPSTPAKQISVRPPIPTSAPPVLSRERIQSYEQQADQRARSATVDVNATPSAAMIGDNESGDRKAQRKDPPRRTGSDPRLLTSGAESLRVESIKYVGNCVCCASLT